MASNFGDQHYVEQIRKKLWCGREFGQAAVFVGAGFSRNAKPISPNTTPFATWSELAGQMFDTLYPVSTFPTRESHTRERLRAISGNGTLKIAQEFALAMGRPALDDLITQFVPDNDYYPGHLHELLLSLPWSDVFTTNYDTLLERTRTRIYDRKYDLVLTASDIPGAMKPRIVKLHGSFPSHRPYIITEEDFRTYPAHFGPFVNTVQQAIMENSLCLVGFSGDDPNFLYWSGWVRDNLGSAAPPIYLVGLLGLSSSQRKVLESRRVVPIDLSPMFPVAEFPVSAIRHQKAMEWFLHTLKAGEPPTTYVWPTRRTKNYWKPSGGLPPIPPGPTPLIGPGPRNPGERQGPHGRVIPSEELLRVVETWKEVRSQYPGWLAMPEPNRTVLWEHTVSWMHLIPHSLDGLSLPQQLEVLYELNWRLNTCLGPVTDELASRILNVISHINPFPGVIPTGEHQYTPMSSGSAEANWGHLSNCWGELAFSLLRYYRDIQNEEAFVLWISKLQNVAVYKPDWELRWHHEQCLFWLNRGSLEMLRNAVRSWPARPDIPVWEMRRAALLAEMGELSEAEGIAESALAEIRSRVRPNSTDLSPLSQEGWAMLLLQTIKGNQLGRSDDYRGEYRDRWEKLGSYRCNPWSTLEQIEAGLLKTAGKTHSIAQVHSAHALLRLYEQAAIPVRCGSVLVGGEVPLSAAQQIAPFLPSWALGVMIRIGKERSVAEWFDQARIAMMTDDEISEVCSRLLALTREALQDAARKGVSFRSPDIAQRQLPMFCEVLSRLCLRLSSPHKLATLELMCQLYSTPMIRDHHFLHKCVESLIKGVMPQVLPSDLEPKMAQLLELPIPEDNGFEVREPQMWPEPFRYVRWAEDSSVNVQLSRQQWRRATDKLLQIVELGTEEARTRAVARLNFLHGIGGLDPEQSSSFGRALWSRLDPTTRLPAETGLYNFAFLRLPAPDSVAAEASFRAFIMNSDVHRTVKQTNHEDGTVSTEFGVGAHDDAYFHELLGSSDVIAEDRACVQWSAEEIERLLDKAIQWWTEEGAVLLAHSVWDFLGTVSQRVELFVRVLERVIVPRLPTGGQIHERLLALIDDLEQRDVCVLSVLPATLVVSPDKAETVALRLRSGLNSWKRNIVAEALEAVYAWLVISYNTAIPSPPSDIVKECVDIVVARRQPGLDSAISVVSDMIKRFPETMLTYISSIHAGLEYLIAATTLPNREEASSIENSSIPFEDRIRYRALAARLAFTMHVALKPLALAPSVPIICRWKSTAETSNIAAIRRAWMR